MEEIWKDVKGYEGLYQVSNFGRVKSLDYTIHGNGKWFPRSHKGKILNQPLTGTGYHFVTLPNGDGKHKIKMVHRLVAETFIENPENKCDVNHKDGNKLNNNVDNLEWNTRQENIQHAFRTGLSRPHHNQVNRKRVEIINKYGKSIIFHCIADAAKYLGVSHSGISRACSGKIKHSGGCVCRFI